MSFIGSAGLKGTPPRLVIERILETFLAFDLSRNLFKLSKGRSAALNEPIQQNQPTLSKSSRHCSILRIAVSSSSSEITSGGANRMLQHVNTTRSNTKHGRYPHIDVRRLGEHAATLQQQTELPRCMALQTRRLVDHDRVQQSLAANLFDQGRLFLEHVHTVAKDASEVLRVRGQSFLLNHIQSCHGNSTSQRVPKKAIFNQNGISTLEAAYPPYVLPCWPGPIQSITARSARTAETG